MTTVRVGGVDSASAGSSGAGLTDWLVGAVGRLPGATLLWYGVLGVVLFAAGNLLLWIVGGRPFGDLEQELLPSTLMACYILWLVHLLNRFAAESIEQFAPALSDAAATERYRRLLTQIPDRVAAMSGGVAFAVLAVSYFALLRPLRPALPLATEAVSFVFWVLAAVLLGVLIVHCLRQLLLVRKLHELALHVDIFEPRPLHAFSRLAAVAALGVGGLAIVYGLWTEIAVRSASQTQPIAQLVQEAGLLLFAAAIFLWPLLGMHERLVAEKVRLIGEAQGRVKLTLSRIAAAVDAGSVDHADLFNDQLASSLSALDFVRRLSTWPWTGATVRGVASALLLPVVIYIINRLIERLL